MFELIIGLVFSGCLLFMCLILALLIMIFKDVSFIKGRLSDAE